MMADGKQEAIGRAVRALSVTFGDTSPKGRGFGSPRKVNGFARGSPTRGAVERSETERLYEGKPDREPLLDSTSPSALTRCHLPYRGEALACRSGSCGTSEARCLGNGSAPLPRFTAA